MALDGSSNWKDAIQKDLETAAPFSLISEDDLSRWLESSVRLDFKPGERLLRPDEMSSHVFLILKGNVRFIALEFSTTDSLFTLTKRGPGQLCGWCNLVRGNPIEHVQASTNVVALSLPSNLFIEFFKSNKQFRSYFLCLGNTQESFKIASEYLFTIAKSPQVSTDKVVEYAGKAKTYSYSIGDTENSIPSLPADWSWHLSTPHIDNIEVGNIIQDFSILRNPNFLLPFRLVALPPLSSLSKDLDNNLKDINDSSDVKSIALTDLSDLGIFEEELIDDASKYPVITSTSKAGMVLATVEMMCLYFNVPFRRDSVKRVVDDHIRREKPISLELIAGICELLGMRCQLAEVSRLYISSVEAPAVIFIEEIPHILFHINGRVATFVDPTQGVISISLEELSKKLTEKVRFVIPRRISTTPDKSFGWHWFTPLLKKYKTPLLLVFISSLLAQLFGLAIPLLIQQIIDKVLSQGNLSSLNVLGSVMIILALFQGLLQALRTYIFVDTTDRMDLTLGSAVIDRLLCLPLSFFERRPVGELSQRIGELNTIRSFLTGTALISVLNIIFAALYLIVMLLYSPLLSFVALSTFPVYLLIVLVVAPIYKSLIRKRAVAQARTQSHLIEVLGGIQTVKAQHFELTARWKWQDRYRHFVSEGFKSSALGTTAGEVGNFLNQLSSLLVLWVGMLLVLKGEFTLGQLIAFRIISGNVTGPLLQLAGLYQGLQTVQLSMERLSDIIDQRPELQNSSEVGQISLPPISGKIKYENVAFRFGDRGPYQLNDVSLTIEPGSFVGIVGQSGSGKSTLMKLLPRLYPPQKGRILIDDYDISKVDLASLRRQIGIVPQDSLLFEGTISENIALNDPQATNESIIAAAKLACAHEFIMTLGQGYATPLSERGSNLSGGQRQRIAIARTILSNPQLLVMDEATSALDYDTERQLVLNLQQWSKSRTVFFITHRLSTIKTSDTIILMHKGALEEHGTHEELMNLNCRYATLFRQQDASSV